MAQAIETTAKDGQVTVPLAHKGDSVSMTFGRKNKQWAMARTAQ